MSSPTHEQIAIDVRYAETDQMAVVHHANYLVWFEQARTELCRRTGYHYADIERMGYYLIVTGAEIKYRQSARYGDRVNVTAWLDRLRGRDLRFAYEVRREDDLLVTGATDHIWYERAKDRSCRIPEVLRPAFTALAAGEEIP